MNWVLFFGLAVLQPTPEILAPGVLSTAEPEFAASISPDGTSFFFNRASADRSRLAILVSPSREGGWGAPETAPFPEPIATSIPSSLPTARGSSSARRGLRGPATRRRISTAGSSRGRVPDGRSRSSSRSR